MEYADHKDSVTLSVTEDHHERRLRGLLNLRDLHSALGSLQKADALYKEYREVSDREGTSLVREYVAKGRQRAMNMAANSRVSAKKRREKQEIAQWFKVWLEVPDLFFDWLEMRQNSEEFQTLFPHSNGLSQHHTGKCSFSV